MEAKVDSPFINFQAFNAGVKDIEFWLGEVEQQLSSDEYGKDLLSVQVFDHCWGYITIFRIALRRYVNTS